MRRMAWGPFPLLVFFHGSGFVLCSLETHDGMCRNLCAGARCVVASVDYRLAPEYKFPAGIDDCLHATRWAAAHAAELGANPMRVAVAGDSSGVTKRRKFRLDYAVRLLGLSRGRAGEIVRCQQHNRETRSPTSGSLFVRTGQPEMPQRRAVGAQLVRAGHRARTAQRGRHHREGLKVCGLAAGGEWIRTISSARADTDVRMSISASKRPSMLTSSAIGR
jgi:hypothetical protein